MRNSLQKGVTVAQGLCAFLRAVPRRQRQGWLRQGMVLVALLGIVAAGCKPSGSGDGKSQELLNVSYDPTRELWRDLNQAFIAEYQAEKGVRLKIKQSHGGSASQARAIIDGLEADVATLSIWSDTDALRRKDLLKSGWEDQFPERSLPYTSTVVFVVRKGNPKGIKDWPDLVKSDIQIITPNPKTSGNGKLSLLAAWGAVVLRGGSEADAEAFVRDLYRRVPVLDTGARGATTTFAQKGIGDVHLTMESEAYLEVNESAGMVEVVYPPISILHEPHVAVVDAVVDQKGTREAATAYLQFMFSAEGQKLIAKHHFRPNAPEVREQYRSQFTELELFPLSKIAESWDAAQQRFFAEGALFDQIYQPSASGKR